MGDKKTFLDDVIGCLSDISAENDGLVDAPPETLRALFAARTAAAKPTPPIATASSAPRKATAPVTPPMVPASAPAAPLAEGIMDCSRMDWEELAATVKACARCPLCRTRTQTVFGVGAQSTELMFIGEGPGADEDAQGLPFVGLAGQLLDKMINAMGYERSEVYIANVVKCRPPGNRNPETEEANQCLPYLVRQIELVRPKVIVLLGAVPLLRLMGKTGISRLCGQWMKYRDIDTMPVFHPAFLLRDPRGKRPVWDALRQVMTVLGKTYAPPRKKGP